MDWLHNWKITGILMTAAVHLGEVLLLCKLVHLDCYLMNWAIITVIKSTCLHKQMFVNK